MTESHYIKKLSEGIEFMYDNKIFVLVLTGLVITLRLYITSYRSIKKFQSDIKDRKTKYFLFLVCVWGTIWLYIRCEYSPYQNWFLALGSVISFLVYFIFFVFYEQDDDSER